MRKPDKPTAPAPAMPVHVAFSNLHASIKDDPRAKFAELKQDVCNGVRLCLEMVQSSLIDAQCDQQPLLSANNRERLILPATRTTEMLAMRAEKEIDHLNDAATKGGAV